MKFDCLFLLSIFCCCKDRDLQQTNIVKSPIRTASDREYAWVQEREDYVAFEMNNQQCDDKTLAVKPEVGSWVDATVQSMYEQFCSSRCLESSASCLQSQSLDIAAEQQKYLAWMRQLLEKQQAQQLGGPIQTNISDLYGGGLHQGYDYSELDRAEMVAQQKTAQLFGLRFYRSVPTREIDL